MSNSSPSSSPQTAWSPGDETLDLAGEVCPFTFVRTRLAMEALPIGSILRVIVDHEPATRNIPRSARAWGQEVLGVTAVGATRWAIDLVRRVR